MGVCTSDRSLQNWSCVAAIHCLQSGIGAVEEGRSGGHWLAGVVCSVVMYGRLRQGGNTFSGDGGWVCGYQSTSIVIIE